jgi:hypothetical protein
MKKLNDEAKNDLTDDDEKKKKKKRSEKKSITTNEVSDDRVVASAPMSEGYMGGNGVFQDDCPLLSAIEKRCRGIDLLTGDTHHNLLEACGAHQLCYLCVSYSLYVGLVFIPNNYFCLGREIQRFNVIMDICTRFKTHVDIVASAN